MDMVDCKMDKKIKLMVLFGGVSGEHTISCATASSVISHINTDKYDVIPVGITKTGKWVKVEQDIASFALSSTNVAAEVVDTGLEVTITSSGTALIIGENNGTTSVLEDLGRIDVALPLLHGPFGEDGTLQGFFEMCNIKYVGCGVFSSAVCMDKHYTKMVLAGAGLPISPYTVITDLLWEKDHNLALDQVESLGYPVFVKPARAGSSLGITRVDSKEDLKDAILKAREVDPKVIVEAFVGGREVESAVLQGRDGLPRVGQIGELQMNLPEKGFYDYENKYFEHGNVEIVCPAVISDCVADKIKEYAGLAFQALGCEGLARVDFFYDNRGDKIVINEVNTMPGFTPYSMYPIIWQKTGMSYGQLVEELIELALSRPVGLR